MANLGPEHFGYMARRMQSMKAAGDRVKDYFARKQERWESRLTIGMRTAEVAVGALAGGVIQGHAGEEGSHIFHVPTDLAIGLGLNIAGFFNAAGSQSSHLHGFGDGFIASFTSSLGFGWGNTWRTTGKFAFGGGGTKGLPAGATKTAGEISPAEMANIVSRVRAASAGM